MKTLFRQNPGAGDSKDPANAPAGNSLPAVDFFSRRGVGEGWLAALLLTLPTALWIFCDKSVWPWDESLYGALATNLWWDLTHHHLYAWFFHMETAFGNKAPGIALFGQFFVPVGQIFGSVEVGLLLFLYLAQVVSLRLIFAVGRAGAGGARLPGWLAAGLVGAAPLAIGMSHLFLVESLQLFAAVYFYWIAAVLPGGSRLRLAAHAVLALSLGMLAKVTFPVYVLAPVIVIAVRWWREGSKAPQAPGGRVSRVLLVAAGFTALLTADWYRVNLSTVLDFMRFNTVGWIAPYYGKPGPFLDKLGYWIASAQREFFGPFSAWILVPVVVAGVVLVVNRGRREGWPRPGWATLLAAASVGQCGFILVLFACQNNDGTRFLLPALPALVVPVVHLLAAARSRLLIAAMAMVLGLQFIWVQGVCFGWSEPRPDISLWLAALETDASARSEVTRIAAATSDDGNVTITGIEIPWLNANTLYFSAAKLRLKTNRLGLYNNLGFAPTNPGLAWREMLAQNPVYFVTLDPRHQPKPPDMLNLVDLDVRDRVRRSPNFARQDYPSADGVEIYRRTAGPK